MRLKHILIPTDLSPEASVAYPYAAALQRATGAQRVTLLHIDEGQHATFNTYDGGEAFEAYTERVLAVRSRLLEEIGAMLQSLGVDARLRQESHDDAALAILEFAHENRVDCIVMAKHGQGGLKMLLGSVSRKIARNHHIPVVLVDAASSSDDADASVRRVFAATDLSSDSELGLRASAALADSLGAELLVGHVQEEGAAASSAVDNHIARAGVSPRAVVVESGSHVAELLAKMATESGADLLAVPSHGKGAVVGVLMGSTTQQLLRESRVPLLIWPADYLRQTAPHLDVQRTSAQ